jgi:hypothetical protein
MWRLWSQKTGVIVRFDCDLTWSNAVDNVRSGKADVVAGIVDRPDRRACRSIFQPRSSLQIFIFFMTSVSKPSKT